MGKRFYKDRAKRKVLTMESTVKTLAVKCYEEQLPDGWEKFKETVRGIDKSKFQVEAILHDKDTLSDDKWAPANEKPHVHTILRCVGGTKNRKVRTLLNMLGIQYRKGVDDELWENHGVETVSDFSGYSMYLTHDTEQAQLDGKWVYDLDEVVTNLTPEELQQVRDGYARMSSERPTPALMRSLDADARKLGDDLKDFEPWLDSQSVEVRSNSKIRAIERSYKYHYNTRLQELKGSPLVRLCVFVQGRANLGKSYAAQYALAGYKIHSVKAGKSGKLDDLTLYHDAIILDDCTCPNMLAMTDNYVCQPYRRNNGNPLWRGKYFIVTSNKTFHQWLNDCHMSDANIEAMRTRFYVCEVLPDENGVPELITISDSPRGTEEEQIEREHMFHEFEQRFDKSLADYHALKRKPCIKGAPNPKKWHPDSEFGRAWAQAVREKQISEQSLKEVTEMNNDEGIQYRMELIADLEVDGEKVYNSDQLAGIKLELASGYPPAFPRYYRLPDDVSAPSPEWCEGIREMRRKEAERLQEQKRMQEEEKQKRKREADAELDKLKKKVLSGEHFEQIKQKRQRQADIEQIFAMPSSLHA